MCGIAGIYRLDGSPVDPNCLLEASTLMRHRGPDGDGFLLLNTATGDHSLRNGHDTAPIIQHPLVTEPAPLTPDLALVHRRLAIIDLSPGGHEPLTVAGEQLWLTFNGEIYNYLELRDELKAQGVVFHSESDAEVLLQAYDQWGVNCLERFVGMFAFAIWDQKRGRLFCARDRFGIKPFYYVNNPRLFAFGSEMKVLRPLDPDAYAPDMNQLFWFLHYGGVFNPPYTFFEGIRELPGGHYLLVENGVVREPVKWWDIDLERARATYNYNDPEGEFLRLMRESVKLRLRSDVPVGTCLSGGLDSSTIVALATEQLHGGRMNSFSSVYPVRGFDEGRYVEIVANQFKTIGHKTTPSSENWLSLMNRITWHQDIPTVATGVYTQNFVMQLAHGNVTVLLDGQGADELFAGYLSAVMFHLGALRRRDPRRWVGEQAAFMAEAYPRFFSHFNAREMAYRLYQYATIGRQPVHVLKTEYQGAAHERAQQKMQRTLKGADDLNQHLYQQAVRDSIPALLHYEDRNSMAYSIEARVPFLDHRLAEFALGVPGDLIACARTPQLQSGDLFDGHRRTVAVACREQHCRADSTKELNSHAHFDHPILLSESCAAAYRHVHRKAGSGAAQSWAQGRRAGDSANQCYMGAHQARGAGFYTHSHGRRE
ncbi:asparagine synthase (glutamine-hydrolyzing) [Candidatus Flexifilum breve]|uniref:asparagine synthase (glutamine-hydrolyzing) n=1 Tax=Candidatus Flexifilum breve TaxID=3140694 RepID=UPI0031CCCB92